MLHGHQLGIIKSALTGAQGAVLVSEYIPRPVLMGRRHVA